MAYKYKADKQAHDRQRKEQLNEFIKGYLNAHPCVDCGNSDIRVLEFDHVFGKKSFCIGYGGLKSVARVQEEIKKCEVRCANCHKIRHVEARTPSCVKILI